MKKTAFAFPLHLYPAALHRRAGGGRDGGGRPAPAPSAEKADIALPARTRSYDRRFTDVDASAWYHDAVAALYEYGLTEGVSSSAYAPGGASPLPSW